MQTIKTGIISCLAITAVALIVIQANSPKAEPPSKPKEQSTSEQIERERIARISGEVKAYADKEGLDCREVTGYASNPHSSYASPKLFVACDNGKTWFVWAQLTNGDIVIQQYWN
jgi:hypothetical protein